MTFRVPCMSMSVKSSVERIPDWIMFIQVSVVTVARIPMMFARETP